jgi:hypothetical protein
MRTSVRWTKQAKDRLRALTRRKPVNWRAIAREFGCSEAACMTQRSQLDWSPERKDQERRKQREARRLNRLDSDRRLAALVGTVPRRGRYTKLERAGHVIAVREKE